MSIVANGPLVTMLFLQALIDGPCSNVGRKQINFKALHLTKFTIPIARSARYGIVKKYWEKEGITEKWNNTTWAKKIANKQTVCWFSFSFLSGLNLGVIHCVLR